MEYHELTLVSLPNGILRVKLVHGKENSLSWQQYSLKDGQELCMEVGDYSMTVVKKQEEKDLVIK